MKRLFLSALFCLPMSIIGEQAEAQDKFDCQQRYGQPPRWFRNWSDEDRLLQRKQAEPVSDLWPAGYRPPAQQTPPTYSRPTASASQDGVVLAVAVLMGFGALAYAIAKRPAGGGK